MFKTIFASQRKFFLPGKNREQNEKVLGNSASFYVHFAFSLSLGRNTEN